MKLRFLFIQAALASGLVLSTSMAAAADDPCGEPSLSIAHTANNIEPVWITHLFDALANDTSDQTRALTRAINAAPRKHQNDPLVQRARLTLAGLLLSNSQHVQTSDNDAKQYIATARTLLRQIHTDTEAALPAALLLAESYVLAGDLPGAVKRNVIAVRWWPEEPAALEALQQRASAYAMLDPAAAQPILLETRNRAAEAVLQLNALAAQLNEENWFDGWLSQGHEPTLTPALLSLFYRTLASESFRSARSAARATLQPSECAREHMARLQKLRHDMTHMAIEADLVTQALREKINHNRVWLTEQHQQYTRAETQNIALGQAINERRNSIAHDEAELTALQNTLASLPAAQARLATQIDALHATSHVIHAQASAEILTALQQTIVKRRAQLLDIAGHASLMLGEIQDPRFHKQ